MSGPSRIFRICDAYESGFGHGLNNDGLCYPPSIDVEHAEAYEIGYRAGMQAWRAAEADYRGPLPSPPSPLPAGERGAP